MFHYVRSLAIVALLLLSAGVDAAVKLPAVISANMVLQREEPVQVWGWADAGEKVTVTFAGQSVSTTADAQGNWSVKLKPMKASSEGRPLTVKGANEIKLDNVLVGEVWIASGQSNMQWTVSRSANAQKEIAAADYPHIRFFTVRREPFPKPQNDTVGQWLPVSPETAKGDLTAVGYFFARELYKELNVPVGILNTNWGGTVAEAWTPREHLLSQPSLKYLIDQYEQRLAGYDEAKARAEHEKALAQWKEQAARAKAEGKKPPRQPQMAKPPGKFQNSPTTLYNGMIHPIINYAVRGAIWYQGESNVGRAYEYRTLFPAMIQSWRDRFANPDMPFYFVQLAPYHYNYQSHGKHMLPEQWESQLLTLKHVPHTGMAVTTDITTINDIHPPNKQDVGKRLALWALAKDYGKNVPFSGPIYQDVKITGDKAIVSFEHAKGLKAADGKPLTHFQIAGADRQWHDAAARIEGDTVVVTSDKVQKPVAVRFAWHNVAVPNLVNGAGLPASPFRTDDWPLETQPK